MATRTRTNHGLDACSFSRTLIHILPIVPTTKNAELHNYCRIKAKGVGCGRMDQIDGMIHVRYCVHALDGGMQGGPIGFLLARRRKCADLGFCWLLQFCWLCWLCWSLALLSAGSVTVGSFDSVGSVGFCCLVALQINFENRPNLIKS